MLLTAQARALGQSTLSKEMRAEGKTEEQINEHKAEVQEELYGKNNDMSFQADTSKAIKNQVMNGANVQNLDNNFK